MTTGTTHGGTPDDGAPDLAGRTFVSVRSRGWALVAGSVMRLTFREDGIAVRAGCNTLFGSASWTGGVLSAPVLASTMMACSPDLMDQDAWLAELLQGGPAIVLEGSTSRHCSWPAWDWAGSASSGRSSHPLGGRRPPEGT